MSAAMTHNLSRIMRSLTGAGKPKYAAVLPEWFCFDYFAIEAAMNQLMGLWTTLKSNQKMDRCNLRVACL